MSKENHYKVVNNENIYTILDDASLLKNEFQLSKEQSEEIDNFVLDVHRQYVAEKKKRRILLYFTESIANFFSNFRNIGYLRPAIALGVLIILVSIFFYFYKNDKTSELATNVKDIKPELNIESPLTPDSNTSTTQLNENPTGIDLSRTKQDVAVNTQTEFKEKDESPQIFFDIARPDEDSNMMLSETSGRGRGSSQNLTREIELKYDTLVALQKSILNENLLKDAENVLTESIGSIRSAQPNPTMYLKTESPGQNLFFDGKYYKSNWKQLFYQNKPINFKIRNVYQKDSLNQYIFVKYEYEKTDKIDKSLDTFQLETTGINLDSLLKMQDY
jgi:hypothetical protein